MFCICVSCVAPAVLKVNPPLWAVPGKEPDSLQVFSEHGSIHIHFCYMQRTSLFPHFFSFIWLFQFIRYKGFKHQWNLRWEATHQFLSLREARFGSDFEWCMIFIPTLLLLNCQLQPDWTVISYKNFFFFKEFYFNQCRHNKVLWNILCCFVG